MPRTFQQSGAGVAALSVLLAISGVAHAQLSSTAYRVLGQVDLHFNGLNMVQGTELNTPSGIVLDQRGGQTHIYIADTGNSRVLAWADVNAYQIGDAPALVLGQPGPQYSNPMGIGTKGLRGPTGMAIDPVTGDLYVADTGDNRVVRFPNPFGNPQRIEPDAVYGQPNFTNLTAQGTSSSSLSQPIGVAFDPSGNLWVTDTGNNRVLRFPVQILNSTNPPADTVIGQKDFTSNTADFGATVSGQGLDGPSGLTFDSQGNLYVSDFQNTRVLKFSGPLGPASIGATASGVWGESNFAARGVPQQPTSSSLKGPVGLAVDSNNLYVAVPNDNRVLIFPLTPLIGAAGKNTLGQPDLTTTTPNTGVFPLASANTLESPTDVKIGSDGTVFIADAGNNRVLKFPANAKSASSVWGQSSFAANGMNQVKPGSIATPFKMAIDYSSAPYALYVADTANNRVLIWKDSVHFQNGDPADLAIGQPNLATNAANVDTQGSANPSRTSLSAPKGIALNPQDGTLYVADSGNHRVLRYPRPVNQSGRITPDAVIGQMDFVSASSAGVTASSLNSPAGVAIAPNGDLFISDTGNNRVLEFPASAGTGASAVRVFGQPNMFSNTKPSQQSAQTLSNPTGIYVDQASNLYVADTGANRVLIFPNTQNAPVSGSVASFVIGQGSFSTGSAGNLKTPVDVAVNSSGAIYVSDNGNNRVLVYPSLIFLPISAASPSAVVGQQSTSGTSPDWDSTDGLATSDSLYGPIGIYVDRQDTLYVGDAGNNRVVQFLKSAAVVNAATFQVSVPVARGGLATLFGAALIANQTTVSSTTWPTVLGNRQVVVNDSLPAPFYYIDQGQVNFQVPSNAPLGTDRIAVRTGDTGELIAGGTLLVAASSPGIFTTAQNGSGQAAVINQDTTINSTANAAPRGSVITLYGTGQGQVSPAVTDGTAAPVSPLSNTVAVPTSSASTCLNSQPSMCVAIGSGFGDVQFSGLAPGYIGLWQINVKIPSDAPTGNVGVRVVINGSPSNLVSVAVK